MLTSMAPDIDMADLLVRNPKFFHYKNKNKKRFFFLWQTRLIDAKCLRIHNQVHQILKKPKFTELFLKGQKVNQSSVLEVKQVSRE